MALASGTLDRASVDVSTNKTLAEGDNGIVQNVVADAITITLPATVVGMQFTVRNGGVKVTNGPTGSAADGTALVTIAPNASDKIMGNGFTSADNKAALNTKATSRIGDEIVLVGDGVNGWFVQRVSGLWARQA